MGPIKDDRTKSVEKGCERYDTDTRIWKENITGGDYHEKRF
jgi:hypothetical protein